LIVKIDQREQKCLFFLMTLGAYDGGCTLGRIALRDTARCAVAAAGRGHGRPTHKGVAAASPTWE
jgi:hypothetical protein